MAKLKNCEWCGVEFEDKHRDGKRFCCRSCASFYRNATYGNPQSGKTGDLNPNWKGVSTQPCEWCSKPIGKNAYAGGRFCGKTCKGMAQRKPVLYVCEGCGKEFVPKVNKHIPRRFCSRLCYGRHPDTLRRSSEVHKGKKLSELQIQQMSIRNTTSGNEERYSRGIKGHHDSPKSGSIFYRSSYERIAYQRLDNDQAVAAYRPEPFTIKYQNAEGKTRRYRPDILINMVDGSIVLVEIKPEWQIDNPKNKLKFEAGKQYAARKGWVFEVWTETELGI